MSRYESWGRYPRVGHAGVMAPEDWVAQVARSRRTPVLAFGCGRSYGDVCLNEGGWLIDTRPLSQVLWFDREAGIIRCEAGMTIAALLRLIVPEGWFLPVTPGTKHVTLGGCVANDVHGKNHPQAGSFGRYVRRFELERSDGSRLCCSPAEHAASYRATIGGLGLTGLIRWVELDLKRIRSQEVETQTVRFDGLDGYFDLAAELGPVYEYAMAWIDGFARGRRLGRGVLKLGRHAAAGTPGPPYREAAAGSAGLARVARPFVRAAVVRGFNRMNHGLHRLLAGTQRVGLDAFFYPLDRFARWNRAYGDAGFVQYQCVLPVQAREALRGVLAEAAQAQVPPFLSVLKPLGGDASPGMLSFPRPGYTLAMDFPYRGRETLALLDRFDARVREAGGAVYPAKDARMSGDSFRAFFPSWAPFSEHVDPAFSSSFWRRVTVSRR